MSTPILDFLRSYESRGALRLHMPGHKGRGPLGVEGLDLTEISGADSLYEASGIIAESEAQTGALFGAHTYYSAEGSSLSIRAMIYLVSLYARESGKRPLILAGRNAHKSLLSALALTDTEVEWLTPSAQSSYLTAHLTAEDVESAIASLEERPTAVYLTSPDYLGHVTDIRGISEVCKRLGVLLLVDNAHGAYLKFLTPSLHPMDLGADMCSDSAHKTLPVITGGGYLHISRNSPALLSENAKAAMALFGSTSPSYLILASLDAAGEYLKNGYRERLTEMLAGLTEMKAILENVGYTLLSGEPMKLTIDARAYGYDGRELSDILLARGIVSEFADRDFLVLMLTPEQIEELPRLEEALVGIERLAPLERSAPELTAFVRRTSVREAMLSPAEALATEDAIGRVVARPGLSCPPAVSVLMPGEEVTSEAVKVLTHYGIEKIEVIK